MHEALDLLAGLDTSDHEWLFRVGSTERVAAGTPVVHEGDTLGSVFLVLDGVLELRIAALGNRVLARLGAGELIGEMSFLTGEAASATLIAAEECGLLAVSRKELEARLAADTGFAARLYRALALLAERRLRERVLEVTTAIGPSSNEGSELDDTWRSIESRLAGFKDLLASIDATAIRTHEPVPAESVHTVDLEFTKLWQAFDDLAGDRSPLPQSLRSELGRRLQRELLPYLLLSDNAERYYAKPRGYGGDFLTIERMYENRPSGTGRLGPVIDACFLGVPTAIAVRNRRGLLAKEILAEIDAHPDRPARVMSLACGPAREVFDVYERLADKKRLTTTLLDIDFQALAFVSDWRDRAGLRKQIRLERGNLVYLALGRQRIELEPQDLVYSIGLIDYFEDAHVIGLLNYVHGLLAPGGRAILGNFHTSNRCKAFLDHVLEWRLIHRSEDDMNRLFASSAFARPCTRILFEKQRINLFAECVKSDG